MKSNIYKTNFHLSGSVSKNSRSFLVFYNHYALACKHRTNTDKIEFYKTIKDLQVRLQDKLENEKVILNSFIMSITPSQSLKAWWMMTKPERESKNVLCLDNDDCIEIMLKKILVDS